MDRTVAAGGRTTAAEDRATHGQTCIQGPPLVAPLATARAGYAARAGRLPSGGVRAVSRGGRCMVEGRQEVERAERWRSLMVSAQGGDAEAYSRLLTEILPFVRSLVRARLRDDPHVDDVTQEVLLSIHTARHTYRPERPLLPWVRTIARNAATDWLRRRARQLARLSDVEAAELPAAAREAPPQRLPASLERALEHLPDGQRQAVVLLKVEGLSVAEAAQRVGITEGALKLRAHRGYRLLRDLLGRERL